MISALLHLLVIFLLPAIEIFPPVPEYVEIETILWEEEVPLEPANEPEISPVEPPQQMEPPRATDVIDPGMVSDPFAPTHVPRSLPQALQLLPNHLENAGRAERLLTRPDPSDDALQLLRTREQPDQSTPKEAPQVPAEERMALSHEETTTPAEQHYADIIRRETTTPPETASEPELLPPAAPEVLHRGQTQDTTFQPVVRSSSVNPPPMQRDAPIERSGRQQAPHLLLPQLPLRPEALEEAPLAIVDDSGDAPNAALPDRLPEPEDIAFRRPDVSTLLVQADSQPEQNPSFRLNTKRDAHAPQTGLPETALPLASPVQKKAPSEIRNEAPKAPLPPVQERTVAIAPDIKHPEHAESPDEQDDTLPSPLQAATEQFARSTLLPELPIQPSARTKTSVSLTDSGIADRITPQPLPTARMNMTRPPSVSQKTMLNAPEPRAAVLPVRTPQRSVQHDDTPSTQATLRVPAPAPRPHVTPREELPASQGISKQRSFIIGAETSTRRALSPPKFGLFVSKKTVSAQPENMEKPVPEEEELERAEELEQPEEAEAFNIEGPAAGRTVISKPATLPEVNLDIEVSIRLKFWVLPDGSVGEVVPLQRGDIELERAAIEYIKNWRFTPVEPNSPQVWGIIPITYTLQ